MVFVQTLVKAGQTLGMQLMIVGSVSIVGNLYSVDLRLIDVETSAILNTATKDIESDIGELSWYHSLVTVKLARGLESKWEFRKEKIEAGMSG